MELSANYLLENPLIVIIYDPIKAVNVQKLCFLGNVPNNIITACTNYATMTKLQQASAGKLLKEQYGSDYKNKLAICDIYQDDIYQGGIYQDDIYQGGIYQDDSYQGGENNENDEIADDDILELLNEKSKVKQKVHILQNIPLQTIQIIQNTQYITNIHMFPEDNYVEIKEKIFLATEIPTYRQHLFYKHNEHIHTTYHIHADGTYSVDIRKLQISNKQSNENTQQTNKMFGISVDKTLYELRNHIHVDSLDVFMNLQDSGARIIYIVDIEQFIQPLRMQMAEILNDSYQFDMFYYGFVVKYWPQLLKECFRDYISAPNEMESKYPELARPAKMLANVYKTEREIAVNNYANIHKVANIQNNISIAITEVTTVVISKTTINLRNLFDKLITNRSIPEIYVYLSHNNKKYLLRKRSTTTSGIAFPLGNFTRTGLTIAISSQLVSLQTTNYIFLNIQQNGNYYIRATFNEEDGIDFESLLPSIKQSVDNVITIINSFGKFVFTSGEPLQLPVKHNVSYTALNIAINWKRVMLENAFKIMRSLWEKYMRGRIIVSRNVQQFDKYEFLFRKGIYEYDTTIIDKISTESNQYTHLIDQVFKQKWDQHYEGKISRMSHRTTDVQFEIVNVKEDEFRTFYQYIVMFIYNASINSAIKSSTVSTGDIKKIRKLREYDPELFNLKKHGSDKIYSILCQNQRQPTVYTQEEIKTMSVQHKNKLTKYWNFTLQKVAYYGCDNKSYPHMSFITGVHPKNYCLPCCNKKITQDAENKRNLVNAQCLRDHKYVESDATDISRHIISYGKFIDPGRLAKLPSGSIKHLLFNTITSLNNKKLEYYLYGVKQFINEIPVGIVYSVSAALDISYLKLVKQLTDAITNRIFTMLLGGVILQYFSSAEKLQSTINDIFNNKLIDTQFKHWSELFIELLHLTDVNCFMFIDGSSQSNQQSSDVLINLSVDSILAGEINSSDDVNILTDKKNVIILNNQQEYYPIFVFDTENYFKTHDIVQKLYSSSDVVINILFNMIKQTHEVRNIDKLINLEFIKAFCLEKDYKIILKYINKQGQCYAVKLAGSNNNLIYTSIDYSINLADSIPISFDAFNIDNESISRADVDKFIIDVNEFITSKYSIDGLTDSYYYKKLDNSYVTSDVTSVVTSVVTSDTNGINYYNCDNLLLYFDTLQVDQIDKSTYKVPKYNYSEINQLILTNAPPVSDNRILNYNRAMYTNYKYQLFLIEFMNYIHSERNIPIRAVVRKLLPTTNANITRNEMKALVTELLIAQSDYNLLQLQITSTYKYNGTYKQLLELFETTEYEFDKMIINKIKASSLSEIKSILNEIVTNFVIEKDLNLDKLEFPNIYLPCADSGMSYCDKNKLVLNTPVAELIDILANDLTNGIKQKQLLSRALIDITIDYFKFESHPSEIITIYQLSWV